MKTKCVCGEYINGQELFCDVCSKSLRPFCVRAEIDVSLISFAIENKEWLKEMACECATDWHGTLSITIKKGIPTHARWQFTKLLQKKSLTIF